MHLYPIKLWHIADDWMNTDLYYEGRQIVFMQSTPVETDYGRVYIVYVMFESRICRFYLPENTMIYFDDVTA